MFGSLIHWWPLNPERQSSSTVSCTAYIFVYLGSMLGWVGPPHDPLSHQLYCWGSPQVGGLVIIPWARGAAVWHKNETIRFTCRENTWLLPDGLEQWFPWRSLRTNISRHHEHRGLETALLLSHPGWIPGNLTNVQASWGSRHRFLKGACSMHGTFGVVE